MWMPPQKQFQEKWGPVFRLECGYNKGLDHFGALMERLKKSGSGQPERRAEGPTFVPAVPEERLVPTTELPR